MESKVSHQTKIGGSFKPTTFCLMLSICHRRAMNKPVFARSSPNMEFVVDGLKASGFEKHLEFNGGRGCFYFIRKLTPDGIFDRQLEINGCRVCYYLNRI